MKTHHNKSKHIHKGVSGNNKRTIFEVKDPSELMNFLMNSMPGKSRNSIKSFLAHRQVFVDNKVVTRHDHPLRPGQQVLVDRNLQHAEITHNELKILFEDAFIIVIEKEHGLLSVPSGARKEITAQGILNELVKKIKPDYKVFPVHRLDRATSGVMMFAKNIRLQHEMRDNWMKIVSERTYMAVVQGQVERDKDTVISWLKENMGKIMYSTKDTINGKKAVTHYKVLNRSKKYSLLEVELETGRKNQIRVHMQDIGHSIVGDEQYGATENPINRLGLHARVLAFQHPVSGEKMRFESPVPRSFLSLVK
jgi:23S rRNA pseudouridine1911/1915/1917 synthase